MINDITKILDLKGSNIHVSDVKVRKGIKEIYLSTDPEVTFCPLCGRRMHSRGIYKRRVNHPIMQDGLATVLIINQRRWRCSNEECRYECNEEFSFVDKYRQNTNVSDLLIVDSFRDASLSVAQIAKRFHVSDSHALNTFLRYVDMPRRQLTEAISIDEVFLNIDQRKKYSLVIQDFITGEPIDLVVSRRKADTLPYFSDIPRGERLKVKYLISDMYRPYAKYIDSYFPNAIHVIDAFHVISLINRRFDSYIVSVQRAIRKRDEDRHYELEQELGRRIEFNQSNEYYLLKKMRWTILKSEKNLKPFKNPVYDHKLRKTMTLTEYQQRIYAIDPAFKKMQSLKDEYIKFNDRCSGNPKQARKELPLLIEKYKNSGFREFEEAAYTLEEFFDPIINSFIMIQRINQTTGEVFSSRLSNGPVESLNRIIKDMKRVSRGYNNFNNIRTRFLFSQRPNAAILAVPKTLEEVNMYRPSRKRFRKNQRKMMGSSIRSRKYLHKRRTRRKY